MSTEDQEIAFSPVPELCLSLWSVRHQMCLKPLETLGTIRKWGILRVEIAGFYDLEATELKDYIDKAELKVCSVIAPPLKTNHDATFYSKWVGTYLPLFGTNHVILQSSRADFFRNDLDGWNAKSRHLSAVVQELRSHGITVGYHCYPHDLQPNNGACFISYFLRDAVLDNFGLQLDTFWLSYAQIDPSFYAAFPVHSVHLNERDIDGRCSILGTDDNRCLRYIRPLVTRPHINWILENDPHERFESTEGMRIIQVMEQCISTWPKLWNEMARLNAPGE